MSESKDLEMEINLAPELSEAAAQEQNYNEGYVRSRITRVQKGQGKAMPEVADGGPKFLQLICNLVPLQDPEDPDSMVGRGLRHYNSMPQELPHWEASVEQGLISEDDLAERRQRLVMYTQMTHEFLSAIFPEEVPDVPRKHGGAWYYQGEEIQEEDVDAKKVEARQAMSAVLKKVWKDPNILVDQLVYHRIAYREGRPWPDCKGFSAEHPVRNDEQVELLTDILSGTSVDLSGLGRTAKGGGEEVEEEEAPKKTTAKKAPAKKAPPAKTKKK